jgi:SAM-dependent methyltransferase
MTRKPQFEDLTETTGIPVSPEGASMMATRYEWATIECQNRRILELGAGAGLAWPRLRTAAPHVVCGDYSVPMLRAGRITHGAEFEAVALSADALPFPAASFDAVVFFEALYYVPAPERALNEISRVLAPGGVALFANANPERPDFIPSPHSVRYFSADQLREHLERLGFSVETLVGFPVETSSGGTASRATTRLMTYARQLASALGLIPSTLRGRARLKRLLPGRLILVPDALFPGFAPVAELSVVAPGPIPSYKVFYSRARKPD